MIRIATENDAEELLNIYAPYVEKTAITFEYEVPSVEEFRIRIRNVLKKYPYIVEEKEGEILGYAYAGVFKNRAAYDWAVEKKPKKAKNNPNLIGLNQPSFGRH